MEFVSQFATNEKAQQLFSDYVSFILSRTNRFTGKAYRDDPAIMSWQIGNEPRAFKKELLPGFERWIVKTAALIRSLDPNHLISIGSEGLWGTEMDLSSWTRMCADSNVDYCNVHLWPYNWGWARKEQLTGDLSQAENNTREYIARHLNVCDSIGKPLVMEEFGYPRDAMCLSPGSPVTARDAYYEYVFSLVIDNARARGKFGGCNFWAWGGFACPRHEQWQPGDDYCGDPSQEAQGLNSVFASDSSTLKIISESVREIRENQ